MATLIMIAQLILGLSILVFIHELGHYMAARAFKIRVEKFYLFFDAWGFKLFKFKMGDTEYGIGWLPLGGYVKIAGMVDESMDKEQMKQPPQPWEFRSKPAWQRLIVMVAGVVMNLILGMIIFTAVILHYEKEYVPNSAVTNGIYAYPTGRMIGFETGDKLVSINGKPIDRFKDVISPNVLMGSTIQIDRNGKAMSIVVPDTLYRIYNKKGVRDYFIEAHNFPFIVDSVVPDGPAFKAGIKSNDKILALDSIPIDTYGRLREFTWTNKGKKVLASVLRNNDTLKLALTIDSTGVILIQTPSYPYQKQTYSFGQGVKYGISDAMSMLWVNIRGIGKIIAGKESASESLQGPIGIMKIYGEFWQWSRFWMITGLLSLVLAFMNILPIPALDGGHVIFTTVEIITRRPVPQKVLEKAQVVGMIILLAIMAFAIFNDVWKYYIK
jgi:regulator of sigma E protease